MNAQNHKQFVTVLIIILTLVTIIALAAIGFSYPNRQFTNNSLQNSLKLETKTTEELNVNSEFKVQVVPQLIAGNANVAEIVIKFDQTKINAAAVREVGTGLTALNKKTDNTLGIVTIDVAAADGTNFSNSAIAEIDFKVVAIPNNLTTINVDPASTLGQPNLLADGGYGSLDIALAGPNVTSTSSSISSSASSISSASSVSMGSDSSSSAISTSAASSSSSVSSSSSSVSTISNSTSSVSVSSASVSVSATTSKTISEDLGNNRLNLVLTSSVGQQRRQGEKFMVGLQPRLIDNAAVNTVEAYITFDPNIIMVTRITESGNLIVQTKNIDNAHGVVKIQGQAASGNKFIDTAIIAQLEIEVIAQQQLTTTLAIRADSKLGFPNTLNTKVVSTLPVALNVPVTSSSSSTSASTETSISSATSSIPVVTEAVKVFGLDIATVVYVLLALAASAGVIAAYLFFKKPSEII
jgi:hypothetical protein